MKLRAEESREREWARHRASLHIFIYFTLRFDLKSPFKKKQKKKKKKQKKEEEKQEARRGKLPRDPVSSEGRDSLLKETVTLMLSEKARVWAGRPRIAGLVNRATFGTMCPSITLASILSRDTSWNGKRYHIINNCVKQKQKKQKQMKCVRHEKRHDQLAFSFSARARVWVCAYWCFAPCV